VINKNKLMQSPMEQKNGVFVARLQAPTGSRLEYSFSITKKDDGTALDNVWDANSGYQLIVTDAGSTDAYSMLKLPRAWLGILWRWSWLALVIAGLLGIVVLFRRQLKNPFLDF
jgi:hypothetical protein